MQLIVFVADQPASLDEYKSHLSKKKGHNFISREDDSNALFEVYFSMDSQVAVARKTALGHNSQYHTSITRRNTSKIEIYTPLYPSIQSSFSRHIDNPKDAHSQHINLGPSNWQAVTNMLE